MAMVVPVVAAWPDARVSAVRFAITLEALDFAAFMSIGSRT
jgi:hypothetical protein